MDINFFVTDVREAQLFFVTDLWSVLEQSGIISNKIFRFQVNDFE